MEKKFTLTDETMQFNGKTLYRIKALKDFNDVKVGDLGGWVECENNLSRYEDCWIYNDAKVMDSATVLGNAKVCGNAEVYGRAKICGDAWVWNNAKISGEVIINENAVIGGYVEITGFVKVGRGSRLSGDVRLKGDTEIYNLWMGETSSL